jgi:hypothetical protein
MIDSLGRRSAFEFHSQCHGLGLDFSLQVLRIDPLVAWNIELRWVPPCHSTLDCS